VIRWNYSMLRLSDRALKIAGKNREASGWLPGLSFFSFLSSAVAWAVF
jgi:hypothetical protein